MKKSYQDFEDNSINNMKEVIHRNITLKILFLGFIFITSLFTSLFAQDGDPAAGKALFNANCAACHKLGKKATGPALRNVEQRLADTEGLDRAWIYEWIRNSSALIKSGDAYANKIYNEYNKSAMTAFPQLSSVDVDNILAYTAAEPATPPPSPAGEVVASADAGSGISKNLLLGALVVLFGLLAIGLFIVNKTLRRFASEKGIETQEKAKGKSLWEAFVKNQFLLLVTAIFFLLSSAYFVYGYLSQVGVDQGYQPVQPIHFSHRIHAGDNKIDCKYCHSSARVSKSSGIPSLNVCMNCHKSIYEYNGEASVEYSKDFYDGEIKKLYSAVGWDDAEQKYTGETKPVEWVRIHNLPDFAYFNHSQHVTVGGVECQTCHGPIQEMEIVAQFAPLTMGWCINCHRETNVKTEGNGYYTKIHEQLSKKYDVDKLTVAMQGGLECGKCHY